MKPHERKDLEPVALHQIALTKVGPYRISTIDMHAIPGLTPRFKGQTIGSRYETMVFRGDDAGDLDMDRYSTEEQARAGHEAMVEKWITKEET